MRKNIFFSCLVSIFLVLGAMTQESCSRPVCGEILCQNGGVCRDGFCQCNNGWSGSECTVKPNVQFRALYRGVFKPGDGVGYYDTVIVIDDTSTVDSMYINFKFDVHTVNVVAEVTDENKFHFDRTLLFPIPATYIEGNGMLEGSRLTMFFQYFKLGDSTLNTTFIGEKVDLDG